jgi:2-polyprenyl-3-methyl-5-hydroxy-6-metoxy-1,4-benzoquinol methylase
LVQSNPRMTDAGYTTFYESDLYRRVYDGDGFLEKYETIYSDGRAEELFSRVTARRPVASIQSLLEFGAGGGWNLLPFIRSGIRVAGYELSTDLVELGNGKGIDLRHGGIEDVEGTYDVILLIHVLEHLTDVPGSLAKLGSHLNPGGMLFVEVPDIEDFFMAQIQNAHTYYFSRKTLEFSASRAGLAMTHQARMEAQISAAFATSASAPLPVEFLAGHYDEMVSMLRQFQRNHRVRTPVRALGRVLDLVGLKEPVRNILKPLSSG